MNGNLSWFRLWAETIDDDKLRLLAFEDRWHFIAILCCKAQGILDETGNLMLRKVAVKLGLRISELDEVARRLAEVGLIDQATLQPLAWDRRQYASDRSTERVRKFREKRDETPTKRFRNAAETETEAEAEAETETEKTPPSSVSADEKASRTETRPSSRGSRLSVQTLPADWEDWTKAEFPNLNARRTFDAFLDYWVAAPGQKGVKADWKATWRNWCRKDTSNQNNNHGDRNAKQRPTSRADRQTQLVDSLREYAGFSVDGPSEKTICGEIVS